MYDSLSPGLTPRVTETGGTPDTLDHHRSQGIIEGQARWKATLGSAALAPHSLAVGRGRWEGGVGKSERATEREPEGEGDTVWM